MAMVLLTQKVIKEAFWKLLSEKSFSKITVKDIVEICGINRNSFYYHFADIPSLARECVMDYIGAVVDHNDKASIEECQEAIFTSLLLNKKEVMNMFHSMSREVVEHGIMTCCEAVAERYLEPYHLQKDSDKYYFLLTFIKCELFGQCVAWLNCEMKTGYKELSGKLCQMMEQFLKVVYLS
ncbi:TetR/AcrR family transcriptional regulator [Lachnospiraceae bacterium HCP1S3_A8]